MLNTHRMTHVTPRFADKQFEPSYLICRQRIGLTTVPPTIEGRIGGQQRAFPTGDCCGDSFERRALTPQDPAFSMARELGGARRGLEADSGQKGRQLTIVG